MAARGLNKLTARGVATATRPGYHGDGRNLFLRVLPTGGKSWVFKFKRGTTQHHHSLGNYPDLSLAQARTKASELRNKLADGLLPTARDASSAAVTWGEQADHYIRTHAAGWKDERQAEQWRQSLKTHGPAWEMPLTDVTDAVVLACLSKIWTTKTETATRLRGRIERIWDSALADGLVTGNNPARLKGWLSLKLPPAAKVAKKRHFPAMPYKDVPAFMALLSKRNGKSADALMFTILTAARTNETTGLTWKEIDGDTWTIAASRMKAGKEHVVPLATQVQELLGRLSKDSPPFLLSENAMLFLLQKEKGMGLREYTVHGFRSAFRDWAADTTDFQQHVIEMALAHTIKDRTEAAYRRGSMLEKRRELMQAWADYCLPLA